MPRVTCRCGERLKVQPDSPSRIECPKCGAKIRLRHTTPRPSVDREGDGFLRFFCPCGRRLKVPVVDRPIAGRCPDCGRVVPVPVPSKGASPLATAKPLPQANSEARTEELDNDDLARLETWAAQYTAVATGQPSPASTMTDVHTIVGSPNTTVGFVSSLMPPTSEVKFEAGLRVCPRCKKPVHIGAANCRECGTAVPRQ